MRIAAVVLSLLFAGCESRTVAYSQKKMTAEEALGACLFISALGKARDAQDFLITIYPLRSQVVTFAIIGFHRDRGDWPGTGKELLAYAQASAANPPIPEGALTNLEVKKTSDVGIVYSTLEDRQRGREFSVSHSYRVTIPVPSYIFASPTSSVAPKSENVSISFDWGQVIVEAIVRAASAAK